MIKKYFIFIFLIFNCLQSTEVNNFQKIFQVSKSFGIKFKQDIEVHKKPSYEALFLTFSTLKNIYQTDEIIARNKILKNAFNDLSYNLLLANDNNFNETKKIFMNFAETYCKRRKLSEQDTNCFLKISSGSLIRSHLQLTYDIFYQLLIKEVEKNRNKSVGDNESVS